MDGLIAALQQRPNVELMTKSTAVDLITFPHHSRDPLAAYAPITCHGAYVFDRQGREVHRTVAAVHPPGDRRSGAHLRNTTNPPGARGDGLAMAHRAGARIINAEYVQFHPTALAVARCGGLPDQRGGARRGRRPADPRRASRSWRSYAPEWKDLAPRDVVARAIHLEMESQRLLPRPARPGLPHAGRGHPNPLPQHLRRVPAASASTSRASRSRSFRRRTTSAAACRWTSGAARTSATCTPSARWAAPACTAPTAWPPPRCWRGWCGAAGPRMHIEDRS